MILAFTGTSQGMTANQRAKVASLLIKFGPTLHTVVHGGCVGADEEFHALCLTRGLRIHVWPSNLQGKWGNWEGAEEVHDPMPPLDRNTEIVREGTHLLAAPKEFQEVLRSGTWSTVRRAKKQRRGYVIVDPSGVACYSTGGW